MIIRDFVSADIIEITEIFEENQESIKELKKDIPYDSQHAFNLLKVISKKEEFVMLVAEEKYKVVGVFIGMISPAFWNPNIVQISELALNTLTTLENKVQAQIQLDLLNKAEKISLKFGCKNMLIATSPIYSMGKRLSKIGYKKISETYNKEIV